MSSLPLLVLMMTVAQPKDADPKDSSLLHFDFREGKGRQVTNRSGQGHDGRIEGEVAWEDGALKFNGRDTYIVVPASPKFSAAGNRITLEIWCKPNKVQGGIIGWWTGSRWLDSRLGLAFMTWKDSRLIGVASDGEAGLHQVRDHVKVGRWTHFVLRLNGQTMAIFADGQLLRFVPSRLAPNITDVALHLGKSNGLGDPPFFDGLIGEVRLDGRALSDGDILARYVDGCRARGLSPEMFPLMSHEYDREGASLAVKLDLRRYIDPAPGAGVLLTLEDATGQIVRRQKAGLTPTVNARLSTKNLPAGVYMLRATANDARGDALGKPATSRWRQSALAAIVQAGGEQRMLNNMVFELVNRTVQPGETVTFTNPRDGWVYVSMAGGEKMSRLPAGEHSINAQVKGETQLIVRLVPAMMYCAYPAEPLAGYCDYDWPYLKRHVLPHINTIVGDGQDAYQREQKEWQQRGGQWFLEQNLPTFINPPGMPKPLTGEFVEKYWTQSTGFTNPYLDGVLADEFFGGDSPDFHGYIDGVNRIANNPKYQGKEVHCWCGTSMYSKSLALDFARTVVEHGWKLAWEVYLPERPTQAAAKDYLDQRIRHEMARWDQAIPGVAEHMIFVLGILCAPPESCNLNPNVDYKVFLEMQYRYLATAPECFGQWGVMVYKSRYAEEEAARWSAKLFRHYCIEGNTEPLYAKHGFKYELKHVLNADFDDGLEHWQADGDITTGGMPGLGGMLNRYGDVGYGDAYAMMTRSADQPNQLSQTIKNLTPGKLYSVKTIVAELQDIEQGRTNKRRLGASIRIEGTDVLSEHSFVGEVKAIHKSGRWAEKNLPYQNHHFRVFRAKTATAKIVLTDWLDEQKPGGPVGEQLLYNFVEVQPWLEP